MYSKTIAILDDEPLFCEVLGTALANEGFAILTYADKESFLRDLPNLSVDLVISDIASSGVNGLDLLRQMSQDKIFQKIPVIIASGLAEAEEIAAFSLGAFEVVSKPYEIEALIEIVNRALLEG